MVISRREIKRKRKEITSTCSLLDDSPKRTKVHAQRKFAQGSNVSSPVITPVKEIEKQEKIRPDVLPEPQELLPMNRPHTEDFLTFLCFRGTSMLPPSLNFFNTAPVDSRVHIPLKNEPIDVCPPLANLSTKTTAGTSERPFIAFGVRKRADPILVSKHMDKKRRHALALQALRRKYQEQKMAKIRAVTISKLSEKTTSKSLVRTRSVTKSETTTKKSLTQKTRVKIVATKHVRVTTRSSIKTPLRTTLSSPIRTQIQKRMCLRSFRGRFIQRELNMQKPKKKKPNKIIKKQEVKTETKKKKETSSEFSSDDDQPLVKTVKVVKPSSKVPLPKVAKKCVSTPKKPIEVSFRVTRASRPLLTSTRDQTVKRKIQISRTLPTKLPFVKLTPPKSISPKQKQKEEKVRLIRTRRSEKSESHEESDSKPQATEDKPKNVEKKVEDKKKANTSDQKDLRNKPTSSRRAEKPETSPEKELKKKEVNLEKDVKKKSEVVIEKEIKRRSETNVEKELRRKSDVSLEKDLKKKPDLSSERDLRKKPEVVLEKDLKKKPEVVLERDLKKKPESSTEKNVKKKPELNMEKDLKKSNIEDLKKKPEVNIEKDLRRKSEVSLETETKKKLEVSVERETRRKLEISPEKDLRKKSENIAEKDLKKKPEVNLESVNIEKESKKKPDTVIDKEVKKKNEKVETTIEKDVANAETKKPVHRIEISTEKKSEVNLEKDEKPETKLEVLPEKKQKLNKAEITTENKILESRTEVPIEKKKPEKPELCAEKKKSDKTTEKPIEADATKRKSMKSDNTSEKKKSKNESAIVVEPKISQRPSRKTKEAAAIYMEILGHKLVSEGDIDDDSISIDSFPELPNVRKTEQRENELKAKAKSKSIENSKPSDDKNALKTKPKKSDINELDDATNIKKLPTSEETVKKKETEKTRAKDIFSDSDSSMKKNKKSANLSKKTEVTEISKRTTRSSLPIKEPLLEILSSDSEEFEIEANKDKKLNTSNTPSNITPLSLKPSIRTRSQTLEESSSESDESTTSKSNQNHVKNIVKNKKFTKASTVKLDNSFSDSDEEPLSKLTLPKSKQNENQENNETPKAILKRKSTEHDPNSKKEPAMKQTKKDIIKVQEKKKDDQPTLSSTKPKRECTKRPQNYLTLFSSSEDEEKYFHGFVKTENAKQTKSVKPEAKCQPTASADLLCKDVDKRFGKGKVNMSTEQIEKWLKESALAGSAIKKEGFDDKHSSEANLDVSLPNKVEIDIKPASTKKTESETLEKTETKMESKSVTNTKPTEYPLSTNSTKDKQQQHISQSISKIVERKTIFRKERKLPTPNISAFSPNNESSVYAFEADNEDAISTPFRRPSRRPSSTATSRSEDSSKYEESSKIAGKFRLPSAVKQDTAKTANKQEVSLMLSTDELNNSTSIAVQLDLDSTEVFPEPVITQTETEDSEQLFYIPLQPGKQSSSQLIQGVAVKLGTKGANGPNQRVVMSAKLVTHTPVGAHKLMEKPAATSTQMYPPTSTIQKSKPVESSSKGIKSGKSCERTSENLEDFKYKVPSSPSASSSSSTKVTKRQHMKTRIRPFEYLNPISSNEFPTSGQSTAALLEAPVFYPNEKEFQDPLEYIEKIKGHAENFGICRIVPPSNFKPECRVSDDMRFTAYNQYVHKMLHRWGPNFKELMAITKYLETQNIALTHPPWIGGMEIDLPRLYQIVQSLGGLKEVIEKKKWPKVSELMKIPRSAQDRVTKLDDIYCKYLLPYDTLSPDEREKLFDEVETEWAKRESRALLRSQQKITNRDTSPNSESDSDDEAEECIVKGRNMALNAFYRIARNTMSMWFKTMEPSPQEVEQEFWKHVTVKQNHICVHSGSIDSGSWGYGFAVTKNSPFARHAWNLKVLTNNSGSVLRSMAPVMGVTVPTLHVGMVFSACCWYRDPHSLPWIEYLHTGGNKIWYGIPDSMSEVFHSTLIKLVPNYCRNKALWLPSDTAMVPPSLLVENGVSLCRTIQEPGQFIVVFPKAFTSSLCTGYVVSESVYLAPLSWLTTAQKVFDELQDSCEPSMFSLEKLLVSIALDTRSSVDVLKQIIPAIELLCEKETLAWRKLQELGLNDKEKLPLPEAPIKKRKKLQNDSGDYECEICCKNLFISWVTESQEAIYCLEHAVEYIEKKKIELQNCKLMYTYNSEEMKNLIEKVKGTIEMKLQKKVAGKST